MKRGILCTLWITVLLPGFPLQAQENLLMKALRDEMGRTMERLQLEEMDKPYYVAYWVRESEWPESHGHSGWTARSRPGERQPIPVGGAEGRRSRPRQHQFYGFRSIAFQGGPRRVSGVSPAARRLQGTEAADLAGHRRRLQAGRPQPRQEARQPSEQDAGRGNSRLQPGRAG